MDNKDIALLDEKAGLLRQNEQLRSENERLRHDRDEWMGALGEFVAAMPISDIIPASGSLQDMINYFKKQTADNRKMKARITELEQALRPFARLSAFVTLRIKDRTIIHCNIAPDMNQDIDSEWEFRASDVRRAAATLGGKEDDA